MYGEIPKIYDKNKFSVWRRKKVHASFAVTPQTAKVTGRIRGKCFVNIEKALICGWEMWTETRPDWWQRVRPESTEMRTTVTSFITIYCCNSFILLFVTVNLLLCLVYKLKFIIDICIHRKKTWFVTICSFRHLLEVLGRNPHR